MAAYDDATRGQGGHLACICLTLSLLFPLLSHARTDNNRLFSDPQDGVSFSYPAEWVVRTRDVTAARVVVGEADPLGASCSLGAEASQELGRHEDRELMRATSAADLQQSFDLAGEEAVITRFEHTTIGNRPAILYEASVVHTTEKSELPYRMMGGLVKVKNRLYSLSCAIHASAAELPRAIFQRIIGSLMIRDS